MGTSFFSGRYQWPGAGQMETWRQHPQASPVSRKDWSQPQGVCKVRSLTFHLQFVRCKYASSMERQGDGCFWLLALFWALGGYLVKNCLFAIFPWQSQVSVNPTGHQSHAIKLCILWMAAVEPRVPDCAQVPFKEIPATWSGTEGNCRGGSLISKEDHNQPLDMC